MHATLAHGHHDSNAQGADQQRQALRHAPPLPAASSDRAERLQTALASQHSSAVSNIAAPLKLPSAPAQAEDFIRSASADENHAWMRDDKILGSTAPGSYDKASPGSRNDGRQPVPSLQQKMPRADGAEAESPGSSGDTDMSSAFYILWAICSLCVTLGLMCLALRGQDFVQRAADAASSVATRRDASHRRGTKAHKAKRLPTSDDEVVEEPDGPDGPAEEEALDKRADYDTMQPEAAMVHQAALSGKKPSRKPALYRVPKALTTTEVPLLPRPPTDEPTCRIGIARREPVSGSATKTALVATTTSGDLD